MIAKTLRIFSLIVTACSAAVGTPVWAGNWSGNFDPGGGTSVTGYNGTNLINISDASVDCLPGSPLLTSPNNINFFYVNGYFESDCVVSLLNATVTLHSNVPGDTADLTFQEIGNLSASSAIWGIDLDNNGKLLGVDSVEIGPGTLSGGDTGNPIFGGNWFFTMDAGDGEPPPCFEDCIDPPPPSVTNVVTVDGPGGFSQTSDPYTFAAVPEPGSLALLAGALGAAGWLTRRRKLTA